MSVEDSGQNPRKKRPIKVEDARLSRDQYENLQESMEIMSIDGALSPAERGMLQASLDDIKDRKGIRRRLTRVEAIRLIPLGAIGSVLAGLGIGRATVPIPEAPPTPVPKVPTFADLPENVRNEIEKRLKDEGYKAGLADGVEEGKRQAAEQQKLADIEEERNSILTEQPSLKTSEGVIVRYRMGNLLKRYRLDWSHTFNNGNEIIMPRRVFGIRLPIEPIPIFNARLGKNTSISVRNYTKKENGEEVPALSIVGADEQLKILRELRSGEYITIEQVDGGNDVRWIKITRVVVPQTREVKFQLEEYIEE